MVNWLAAPLCTGAETQIGTASARMLGGSFGPSIVSSLVIPGRCAHPATISAVRAAAHISPNARTVQGIVHLLWVNQPAD